jgi:hypothetical protein
MRRILLGGFATLLGVCLPSLSAQEARPSSPQPQRTARLARPEALPDGPLPDGRIEPAGHIRNRPITTHPPVTGPVFTSLLGGLQVGPPGAVPSGPVYAWPITGVQQPSLAQPGGEQPMGTTLGSPKPLSVGGPTITEDRSGTTPGSGTASGSGSMPNRTSGPVPDYLAPTLVPGVGLECGLPLQPGYDCPLPYDCPVISPGYPALARVTSFDKWWVSSEYLMWWTRSTDLPPLITTSSPQFNGILGQGDTRIVLGGPFGQTFHSGLRVGLGYWFGCSQCRGIDSRMFFLGQAASFFTVTTGQYPLLARPFFNVNTPLGPFSEIVGSVARGIGGGITVQLESSVWGAEVNYRRYLWDNGLARLDGLVGYRFVSVSEQLRITESFARPPSLVTPQLPQVAGTIIDQFKTTNDFHGGQIGLAGSCQLGRWFIDARTTVAFGNLTRTLDISGGQQLLLADGTIRTANGGLLALPGANIGRFSENSFAVVPEVGVNVGYQLTSRLRFFVGYNFLYIGNAVRPGSAIDPYVDAARIPNFPLPGNPSPLLTSPPRPAPQFRSSDFFVQGISFGLQFNW